MAEYENVPIKITKEDVLYGNWEDFYIYTGDDDPEINVDEITKVQFFFSDNSVISADEELLGKINKIIE